jgi:hypothetical protein
MVFRVGVWSSQSVWVPCHWTSNWWRGRQQTEPDTPARKKSYQMVHGIWAKFGLRGEYLSYLSPPIDREQTWGPLSDSGRTALARGSQVGSTHSGPHSGWNASCTANLWIGCPYYSVISTNLPHIVIRQLSLSGGVSLQIQMLYSGGISKLVLDP